MSLKCTACDDPLPKDDFVQCTIKKCKLHYECSGLTEKTYRQMGATRRETYRCRLCREDNTEHKKPAAQSPTRKQITLEDLFLKIENMEFSVQKSVKDVKDEVFELQKSVSYSTDKIDDFIQELQAMNKKLSDITKENNLLQQKNKELEDKVQDLHQEVQEMQQYSRRFNIQLDGVPEVREEKAMDIVTKLATLIDEPIILNQDVQAAHRLPTNNTRRTPSFLIQFTNKQKRDAVIKKARQKKLVSTDFVSNAPQTLVFSNDHLTPYYKKLLYEARKAKVEKAYEFVWVNGGKIFVKKDKDSRAIRIESMKDIEKM